MEPQALSNSAKAAESREFGSARPRPGATGVKPECERFEARLEQSRVQREADPERVDPRAEHRQERAVRAPADAQVEREPQATETAPSPQTTAAVRSESSALQEPIAELLAAPESALQLEPASPATEPVAAQLELGTAQPEPAAAPRDPAAPLAARAELAVTSQPPPVSADAQPALAISALDLPSEPTSATTPAAPVARASALESNQTQPLELESAGSEAPIELDSALASTSEVPSEPASESGAAREPQAAFESELKAAARADEGPPAQAVTRESAPRATERAPEAAAKAAAPKEPPVSPERAADMLRQLRLQLSPELRQAVLQLEPRELGRISIRVALRGESAHAELRVEKRSTLEALERQMPELKAAFERSGLGGGELALSLDLAEQGSREHSFDGFRPRAGRIAELPGAAPRALAAALARRLPNSTGVDTYA